MSLFENREITIATKHGKERCLAPLLESALNLRCTVPHQFDSDVFGSFCGSVQRKRDPLTTARMKCVGAMALTGTDMAIASEGSFGPHPESFFGAVDDEIVLLVDRKNGLEIVGRAISAETNFSGMTVRSESELLDFANSALFPSHGLMIRRLKDHPIDLHKGLTDNKTLLNHCRRLLRLYGEAYVETDMRAMLNPSRMKVIAMAAKDLIKRALSNCPECNTPGFGITDTRPGLPCELCGFPTKSISSLIYACRKCGHRDEIKSQNRKTEDPQYCDNCNP